MKEPAKDALTPARLEFELALEIGDAERPLGEIAKQAAESAGGDLLFALPGPDGSDDTAVVRFPEGGGSRFVQVRRTDDGYLLAEDSAMDAPLLGFARASLDVLERLRADERVVAPLTAAH
ncbi:MAG TPA: hypothetical protein VN240_06010 [Propylenella sp.]|nr:hypothetical protein [Propylenella sp.]